MGVQSILAATAASPEQLTILLETRHTNLRLPALHLALVGCHAAPASMNPGGPPPDYYGIVLALLDAGARIDSKDLCGYTVMHRVGNGYARSELVLLGQLLSERGADANVRHRFGDPPIMEGCMAKRLDIVLMMLEADADPSLRSSFGDRASPLTCTDPQSEVHDALRLAEQRRALVASSTLRGRKVQLHGLSNNALNGRTGVCGKLDPLKGRYTVALDSAEGGGAAASETVAVKFNRLRLVSQLQPGKSAAIKGGEHDGKRGTLQSLDGSTGKWRIRLDADASEVSVAAEMLRSGTPACGHCGLEKEGMLRCAGCLRVVYCGRECQTAGWKGHKKACKSDKEGSVAEVDTTIKSVFAGMGNLTCVDARTMKVKDEGGKEKMKDSESKKMVVKVQLPMSASSNVQDPFTNSSMKVDSKHKKVQSLLADSSNTSNFQLLWKAIDGKGFGAAGGSGGLKAYFNAVMKDNGKLCIDFGTILSHESF
mmetsp:Transcript_62732/g.143775  ORF Transcript_62732/g.143775 Transcript_62732/m.143775 type:complete len:483 (-) Transcript_62732:183-1631(-)